MAAYWIALFSTQYRENKDANFISIKTFNVDPTAVYPTFSICFEGDKFNWYQEERVFRSYALNSTQFRLMLKGEMAIKDHLNETSKLYNKKPVNLGDGLRNNIDKFRINAMDFLSELKYITETEDDNLYYFNDGSKNLTTAPYIDLSYQTTNKTCFTRNPYDGLKTTRTVDLITFNNSVIGNPMYNDTKVYVYIHYPGHLIKAFDKPAKYEASLAYMMSTLKPSEYDDPSILEFKISQVKTLKKRPDSNDPCNEDIVNYDQYFQEQVVKKLGCIPPYWVSIFSDINQLEECTTPTKLRDASLIIEHHRIKEITCTEMNLLSIDSINNKPHDVPSDVSIAFYYPEKTFEEIRYTKMMEFVGWLSNVGGFVGIFLGYSIMQFPQLLFYIIEFLYNQRKFFFKR